MSQEKPVNNTDFKSLGIRGTLLHTLEKVGYNTATPIQVQAIPRLLEGKDLLGVAQTGTGKTAAFGLPLIQRLIEEDKPAESRRPKALILAPTRELALQIHEEMVRLSKGSKLRTTFVFGGVGQNPQVKALARGVDILVATPGRLLDLAAQGHLKLSELSVLVLDEADRLLDMGFIRDVKRIVSQTPKSRQSLLFSATMPKEVAALAREILRKPIRVDVSPKEITVKEIDQRVVYVGNGNKQYMLDHLLRDVAVTRAIVFTRTKHGADKVTRKLLKSGISAEAIHGNKSQNARQRALQNFKQGRSWVLVATDIAARGIDIEGVSHVFNYELPHEPESYVHRIGRTGRAGAKGIAWALVDPSETKRLRAIERLIKFSPTEEIVDLPPRPEGEVAEVEPQRNSNNNNSRNSNPRNRRRKGPPRQRDRTSNDKSTQSSEDKPNRPNRKRKRRQAA